MSIALDIMFWPLIACLLLPGILIYYGLHIVRREIIFVDLALAQVAALGTCVAILLGHDELSLKLFTLPALPFVPHGSTTVVALPYSFMWSFGFSMVGAIIFTITRNARHHARVPQEALIGIVYVFAAAASILLLSKGPAHANEELRRTLVGEVLNVTQAQVWKTFALYIAIAVVHFIFRKQFLALSFEPERAAREGLAVRWWDFLFYALFGLVVTSFVQIGGVLLVFSYLIVPAVCATFLSRRLLVMLAIGWGVAMLASLAGLFASYQFDLPTGAAVVCVLGLALLITATIAGFVRRSG